MICNCRKIEYYYQFSAANERGTDGRLKRRSLTSVATSVALSDLSYVYDPDGNITSIDDAVTPERSAIYGHDPMGRLDLTVAEGSAPSANYSYTQGTNKLASVTTSTGTRSITYDARGNPVSEARPGAQTVDLDYDGQGRLTSYARSGEASLTHAYNGLDDRVSTTSTTSSGSETRQFVYAPDGRVIGEYGNSGSDVKAEFIWASPEVGDGSAFGGDDGLGGYMPLAVAVPTVTEPDRLLWVHGKHMGVPAVFTNANGTVLTFPTGYSLPGFSGQSRTFADLYYNRYRDYDTSTGRYIQADPIGLAGGSNPYSYAMNSPLRYTDPDGLNPVAIGRGVVAVGRTAGWGLTLWCRNNIALCMRTIGPAAIRVSNAIKAVSKFCEGDDDGPCEEISREDELECNQWNITGARDGYSRKEGLAQCYKTIADRYAECKRHGPEGIRTQLFFANAEAWYTGSKKTRHREKAMTNTVAVRKVYAKLNHQCVEVVISILRPVWKHDELATCLVKFSGLQRYDTELSGVDEINALECAISYVSKICRENAEPKFFWEYRRKLRRCAANVSNVAKVYRMPCFNVPLLAGLAPSFPGQTSALARIDS